MKNWISINKAFKIFGKVILTARIELWLLDNFGGCADILVSGAHYRSGGPKFIHSSRKTNKAFKLIEPFCCIVFFSR